ncbi:MAG TPA: cytochrome b/b6 domain-containing protein [Mycobacteriales bacterium]|nr:cytochrome b/b6 domain-containing protein [Mycobacteriales bacterium]
MSRPADRRRELLRFTRPVRWVHAVTAALLFVCIATAAILYIGSIAVLVGDRYVIEQVHVWCGLALPVPLIVGLLSPSYRADLRRLNRFTRRDWRWLRSRSRRDGQIMVGKFNAGQKLNAALSLGAIGVLLMSGVVMYFTHLTRLSWRSGATFVHDWVALALGLLVIGHVMYAVRDPEALRSMRTGRVPLRWAQREHLAWADEMCADEVEQDQVDPVDSAR